jgi:hypothetical protein
MTTNRARLALFLPAAFSIAIIFAACGKSTVKPGHADPDFALASLRADTSMLIVSANVQVAGFEKAFANRFATGDALAAYLAQRILDSLNAGDPKVPAIGITSTRTARFRIQVADIAVGKAMRELPVLVLPSTGENALAPAGGGTSESCTVTFNVEVWEADSTREETRRLSFTVTGRSDVVLYAYKSALVEALNAAARRTAWHLRGDGDAP